MKNDSDASECLIAGSGYQNKKKKCFYWDPSIAEFGWLVVNSDDVQIMCVSLWLHRISEPFGSGWSGRFPELKLATHMNI